MGDWLQLAILVCASFTSLRALNGPFLFDDPGIWDLPFDKGYPFEILHWRRFRPQLLLHAGYWLNWRFGGFNPRSWHAVNSAFHTLNVVLVWSILARVWPDGAFWSALVFAVHPLHTGAAAYVSGRGNLQSLAFSLAGVLVALHGWVWLGLLGIVCAWLTRRDAWVYAGYFSILLIGAK